MRPEFPVSALHTPAQERKRCEGIRRRAVIRDMTIFSGLRYPVTAPCIYHSPAAATAMLPMTSEAGSGITPLCGIAAAALTSSPPSPLARMRGEERNARWTDRIAVDIGVVGRVERVAED